MPITPGPAGTVPFTTAVTKPAPGAQPVNGGHGGTKGGNGSSAPNNTIYNNPNFDARIYTVSSPMQGGTNISTLQRGFMTWALKVPGWGGGGGAIPTVRFLYNPTTVSASYSTDVNDTVASQTYTAPADAGNITMGMQQSISFSLLFDRTFELWGSTPAGSSGLQGGNSPAAIGVDADVLAMKQLAGMFWYSASQRSVKKSSSQAIQQGPMMMFPTYLNFGSIYDGETYYGYVSSFDVTYTHWTHNMIPMRCTIDVGFTLLIPPSLIAGGVTNINSLDQATTQNSAFYGWSLQQLGVSSALVSSLSGNLGNQGSSSGTGGR